MKRKRTSNGNNSCLMPISPIMYSLSPPLWLGCLGFGEAPMPHGMALGGNELHNGFFCLNLSLALPRPRGRNDDRALVEIRIG